MSDILWIILIFAGKLVILLLIGWLIYVLFKKGNQTKIMEINSVYPNDISDISEKDARNLWPKTAGQSDKRPRPLAIIVALGRDSAIGRNGDLIRHLPGDLKRFKELTTGHTVIMGRKTWDSLPKRPLPGRRNIIITRNKDLYTPGAECAGSLEEAIDMASDDVMPFIIGGGEIYARALPLASHLFLTHLDADTPDADTFFPTIDHSQWTETFRSQPLTNSKGEEFVFADYIRK